MISKPDLFQQNNEKKIAPTKLILNPERFLYGHWLKKLPDF